jgi:hypothetical protein
MTIEFQGHVSEMKLGTSDRVKVRIQTAMHRMEGKPLDIEMSREEARQYMPGSGVTIQLRPSGPVGAGFPTNEPL